MEIDPVYRILAYPHTPSCTLIDRGLLKAPPTAREQRKKIWGAELGRVAMAVLIIILLVLILVRLLQ
jgi:hypothetical protein